MSDHAPIYVFVDLNLQPKINDLELNSSLFNDPHYKEQIKRDFFYLEMNDKGDVSPPILWHFLYLVLHRFGLHEIIKTVQALYNKPTATIK